MQDVAFTVTLTVRGPVLSRSASAARFGLDAAPAVDKKGRPYLPDTLIRGCLLDAFQKIQEDVRPDKESLESQIQEDVGPDKETLEKWFGTESTSGTYDAPNRGCLEFSDFTAENAADGFGLHHRIAIDEARGAVKRGALAVMELPFPPGKEVAFTGVLRTFIGEDKIKWMETLLLRGFRRIAAVAGQRGTGFGEITDAEVTSSSVRPMPAPVFSDFGPAPEMLCFSLRPLSPFCISRHTAIPNLFESEEIISGSALKGALAGTLNTILNREPGDALDGSLPAPWTELGRHFHAIRVSHALPLLRNDDEIVYKNRPIEPPLSAVVCKDRVFDIALKNGPGLIGGEAPAFAADWKFKHFEMVRKFFGWPDLSGSMDVRVHTAIDAETRRAKDKALFAVSRIIPDDFEWLGRINLAPVPEEDRAAVTCQLQSLFEFGLVGLSKTKARAEVLYDEYPYAEPPPMPLFQIKNGEKEMPAWVAVLQSDAVMADPEEIAGAKGTAENLKKAYEEYWDEISGGSLVLHRFFARQILKGRYLFYHFQKSEKAYNPYLLTAAGSTFVLTARDDAGEAGEKLSGLLKNGLPLPGWAATEYGGTWDRCPWVPENGFGEIAVNLPVHTKQMPGGNASKYQWEEI